MLYFEDYGSNQILASINPSNGIFDYTQFTIDNVNITEESSRHMFNTSRVFGPDIATAAHCSETLVTFTLKSVQRI